MTEYPNPDSSGIVTPTSPQTISIEQTGLLEDLHIQYTSVFPAVVHAIEGRSKIPTILQEFASLSSQLEDDSPKTAKEEAKLVTGIRTLRNQFKDIVTLEAEEMKLELTERLYIDKCRLILERCKILKGEIRNYLENTVYDMEDDKLVEKVADCIDSLDELMTPLVNMLELFDCILQGETLFADSKYVEAVTSYEAGLNINSTDATCLEGLRRSKEVRVLLYATCTATFIITCIIILLLKFAATTYNNYY